MITTLPEHLKPMVEKARIAFWDTARNRDISLLATHEAAILAFLNACLDGGGAIKTTACTGCGSQLALWEIQKLVPDAISCCPERRVSPALILSLGEAK